jgi:hypothetical protein
MWNTEFDDVVIPVEPIYLAVDYIIGYTQGLVRQVWYQFDNTLYGYLEGGNQGMNAAGIAYRVVESWLLNSTWTSAPVRQANANQVANTTMAGAVAGTPGTVPTGWYMYSPGNSVTTQIVSVGTISGVNYIDFKVSGTPTASSSLAIQLPNITASIGQMWTFSMGVSLQAGAVTNTHIYEALSENGGPFDTVPPIVPIAGVPVNQQIYWTTVPLTGAGTTAIVPQLQISYTNGQQIGGSAAGMTLRIALPSADNGSIWQGDLTQANGTAHRIVWDAGGGPTAYSTSYNYWRDIAGQEHPINGGSVTLTNSPIILDTAIQGVRF